MPFEPVMPVYVAAAEVVAAELPEPMRVTVVATVYAVCPGHGSKPQTITMVVIVVSSR